MSIVAWVIVGIIAGWLAKLVVPRAGPAGVLGDLVVGIVGALIGGWLFESLGHVGVTGLNVASIIVAFVGGVILLFLLRLVGARRGTV